MKTKDNKSKEHLPAMTNVIKQIKYVILSKTKNLFV